MAHDSSLLLAPGSQKDLEKKKNHKQKQAGVQAETTVSLSPPRGLPLCISPSSPTARGPHVNGQNPAKVASSQD